MKALAEDDLDALLRALPPTAGLVETTEPHALDREVPGSSVRMDLLVRVLDTVVHGEYVKDLTGDLALRMVDYRVRLRRRHPNARIIQFVLVLRDGLAVPNRYDDDTLSASWDVVHVANLDRERLLGTPTSAALAALSAGSASERAEALTAATNVIARVEPSRRRRLLDAAATLASIHLPPHTIESSLQEATMPVPIRELPLARALLDEGRAEGRAEGHAEGRAEGERRAAVRLTAALLHRRFGDDARIAEVAERLVELPDDERLDRIASADDLRDLLR